MQNINLENNISQTILTTCCLCFDLLMHIVKQLGISNCTLVLLNTALQSWLMFWKLSYREYYCMQPKEFSILICNSGYQNSCNSYPSSHHPLSKLLCCKLSSWSQKDLKNECHNLKNLCKNHSCCKIGSWFQEIINYSV
jgi:hypothetical protein